ncbi:MAG: hypothetical protein RJA70_4340 [Pseudomonadota bacterium]|jgi:hypothetical protein
MISKLSLPNAEESAIQGIQRSHRRLESAAAQVARSGLQAEAPAVVKISAEGRSLAAPPEQGSVGDLAGALVDAKMAKHEQAANLKVLQTSDEMTRELLKSKRS